MKPSLSVSRGREEEEEGKEEEEEGALQLESWRVGELVLEGEASRDETLGTPPQPPVSASSSQAQEQEIRAGTIPQALR